MNSTVWYRQINEGLKSFIQSIITISDKNGNLVPVPVRVRKADENFKKEDYPMVTIYNLYTSKRDEKRYYPFKVARYTDTTDMTCRMERPAVPYSLEYQIDFFSTLMSDMDEMLAKWEFEVGRTFNLPVIDSGGTLRYAHALQTSNTLQKQDKLSDSTRIFNSSLTYRIWAELDEEGDESKLETVPLVTEIIIDVHDKDTKRVLAEFVNGYRTFCTNNEQPYCVYIK